MKTIARTVLGVYPMIARMSSSAGSPVTVFVAASSTLNMIAEVAARFYGEWPFAHAGFLAVEQRTR